MLVLQAPANVRASIDRILAAHSKLTAFEARIERPGAMPLTLARSGSSLWLRLADRSGLFPSTRTFCAKPTNAWRYDSFFAEIAKGEVKGATPFERLANVAGNSDDAVRLLLDPASLTTYLKSLARVPGAKLTGSTLVFPEKPGTTRLTFDPATHRVTRLATPFGETRTAAGKVTKGTDVRYVFGKFGLTGFAPVGARPVVNATVLGGTKFGSVSAKEAVERMLRRNARLTRASATVETDEGSFRVSTAEGRLRQTGPRLDLGYDGKTLVVVDRRNRKTYRGVAKRGDVRRIAVKLGEPLLPLSMAFLGRSLPFAGAFFPPRQVSLGATLPGPAGTTDILKLTALGTRTTLFVGPDGLVTSFESEEKDRAGQIVAFGRQKFTYSSAVGSPGLPTAVGSILPLPKSEPAKR